MTRVNTGGGGVLGNPIASGFLEPPLFLKWILGGFKGVFRRHHTNFANFFGCILLSNTSKVLSLPLMQPLLFLSPLLGAPENVGVT